MSCPNKEFLKSDCVYYILKLLDYFYFDSFLMIIDYIIIMDINILNKILCKVERKGKNVYKYFDAKWCNRLEINYTIKLMQFDEFWCNKNGL